MRGRLFFFLTLAAIVAVVLAFSGVFGPLGSIKRTDEMTQATSPEKSAPMMGGISAPSIRWTAETKSKR